MNINITMVEIDMNIHKLKDFLCENQGEFTCEVCDDLMFNKVECKICKINVCLSCAEYLNLCKMKCVNTSHTKKHFITYDQPKGNSNNLTFRCKNIGCSDILPLKDFIRHLINCEYLSKNCPFQNCDFKGKEENIISHKSTCEMSKTKCYLCGEIVTQENKQSHSCLNKFVAEIIKLEDKINSEAEKNVKIIENLKVTLKEFLKTNLISSVGTCKKCYESVKWINRGYSSGTTTCESDNCVRDYRFWCEPCKILYCINCAKPPTDGTCGCGVKQVLKELFSNSCDLCREHIEPKGYRCQTCDYDTCLNCYSGN